MKYDHEAIAIYRKWRSRLLAPNCQSLGSHRACIFLASHGYAFLADFGFDNAQDKATALRARLKQKATTRRTR